jgi:F-type H+-transporting ATPase subunit a
MSQHSKYSLTERTRPARSRRLLPRILVGSLALVLLTWAASLWAAPADAPPAESHTTATSHAEGNSKPHEHDPFEEFQDSNHWAILPTLGLEFHLPWPLTKFMILEIVAALIVAAIYIPLAHRVQDGSPPRGIWDNFYESFLTFVRNDVARPNIGEHDADRFMPFLWTLFLFILFCNLLGMIPYMGSPTANLYVTGALALCSFVAMHGAAVAKMGFGPYLQSLWPHMEIPFGIGYFLKPMIFFIELLGTVIKSGVLAVRLFANIFAGHTVLAIILSFIILAAGTGPLLWGAISGASVAGVVALSFLELFVAFLHAYIFVFLTALFIGMAMHPQH